MTNTEIRALPVKARFIRRQYLAGACDDAILQLFVDAEYITAEQMRMFQEEKANMNK